MLTFSDSSGFVYDPDGIDQEQLEYIKDLKEVRRGRVSEYVEKYKGAEFHEGKRPWHVPAEVALPCATQNEINLEEAKAMLNNGIIAVSEGANMPTELDGVHAFIKAKILFWTVFWVSVFVHAPHATTNPTKAPLSYPERSV